MQSTSTDGIDGLVGYFPDGGSRATYTFKPNETYHDFSKGGPWNVIGNGLSDTMYFGAAFNGSDTINGEGGYNYVSIAGNYGSLTLQQSMLTNIEALNLAGGYSYNIISQNLNIPAAVNSTFGVNAGSLGSSDSLTFNGSAETNGQFAITSNAGSNNLTGGSGNDIFLMGANFNANDHLNGEGGYNYVDLAGSYSDLILQQSMMTNIEALNLAGGSNYNITSGNLSIAASAGSNTLGVDASALGQSDSLTFNGGQETDGTFSITSNAGTNILTGGSGDDFFRMGGNFNSNDQIDGGGGYNYVYLAGNYANLTLLQSMLTNIEALNLAGGYNYSITSTNLTVPADVNSTFGVNAGDLGSSDTLVFDGSQETSGQFAITSNAGTNVLTGGSGNDIFLMGADFNTNDTLNGGSGYNYVDLAGNYTGLTLQQSMMTNIEALNLAGGYSYNIVSGNLNIAPAGGSNTLGVNASALGPNDALTFNGSQETNGTFSITSNADTNVLTGGSGNDLFFMGAAFNANDQIDGGAGYNTVNLTGSYGGLTLQQSMMTNIEALTLTGGYSYDITSGNLTIPASVGSTLKVDASGLTSSDLFNFDGSQETSGSFAFDIGPGEVSITGGSKTNYFLLGGTFNSQDFLDGGNGNNNILVLNNLSPASDANYTGANALILQPDMVDNISTLLLSAGYSYDIQLDGNLTLPAYSTNILSVLAYSLSAANTFSFDGSQDITGSLSIYLGAAASDVTGGGSSNNFYLGGTFNSNDALDGGNGTNNILYLNAPSLHPLDANYTGANALTITSSMIANIQSLVLGSGYNYDITVEDLSSPGSAAQSNLRGNFNAGGALTIDGSALGSNSEFVFDDQTSSTSALVCKGGAGSNIFDMGSDFTSADDVLGDGTNNTLKLAGDYTGANALTISSSMISDVQSIVLGSGYNYDITLGADADSGQIVAIDGSALVSNSLSLDCSAFTGTIFIGCGAGTNTILMGANLTTSDQIYGSGLTSVSIGGANYDQTFSPNELTNISALVLQAGSNYALTLSTNFTSLGQAVTINGANLGPNDSMTIDASQVALGGLIINGGAGPDSITLGQSVCTLNVQNGAQIYNVLAPYDTLNVLCPNLGLSSAGYYMIKEYSSLTSIDVFNSGSAPTNPADEVVLAGSYDASRFSVTTGTSIVNNSPSVSLTYDAAGPQILRQQMLQAMAQGLSGIATALNSGPDSLKEFSFWAVAGKVMDTVLEKLVGSQVAPFSSLITELFNLGVSVSEGKFGNDPSGLAAAIAGSVASVLWAPSGPIIFFSNAYIGFAITQYQNLLDEAQTALTPESIAGKSFFYYSDALGKPRFKCDRVVGRKTARKSCYHGSLRFKYFEHVRKYFCCSEWHHCHQRYWHG